MLDDNIKITVVQIGRNTVRLGIDAPREVRILRQEHYDNQQAQDRESQHTELEVPRNGIQSDDPNSSQGT